MSEMEFCFQVQLDGHVLHTIFRLPPDLKAVWSKCGDHVLNEMAVGVEGLVIRVSGVTYEAFLVLLQVANNTVGLWFVQSTCRSHGELLRSADEKVASGRVAAAFCAAIAELRFLSAHSGAP